VEEEDPEFFFGDDGFYQVFFEVSSTPAEV
jgi:hypothetical protein